MPHSSLCQSQTINLTIPFTTMLTASVNLRNPTSAKPTSTRTLQPELPSTNQRIKKKTIIKGGGAANRGIIPGRSCKQRDHSQRGENKKIQSKNGGIRGGNSDNKWAVESTSVYSINSVWLTTQLQAHHPSPRLNHSPKLATKRIPRRNHPKSR